MTLPSPCELAEPCFKDFSPISSPSSVNSCHSALNDKCSGSSIWSRPVPCGLSRTTGGPVCALNSPPVLVELYTGGTARLASRGSPSPTPPPPSLYTTEAAFREAALAHEYLQQAKAEETSQLQEFTNNFVDSALSTEPWGSSDLPPSIYGVRDQDVAGQLTLEGMALLTCKRPASPDWRDDHQTPTLRRRTTTPIGDLGPFTVYDQQQESQVYLPAGAGGQQTIIRTITTAGASRGTGHQTPTLLEGVPWFHLAGGPSGYIGEAPSGEKAPEKPPEAPSGYQSSPLEGSTHSHVPPISVLPSPTSSHNLQLQHIVEVGAPRGPGDTPPPYRLVSHHSISSMNPTGQSEEYPLSSPSLRTPSVASGSAGSGTAHRMSLEAASPTHTLQPHPSEKGQEGAYYRVSGHPLTSGQPYSPSLTLQRQVLQPQLSSVRSYIEVEERALNEGSEELAIYSPTGRGVLAPGGVTQTYVGVTRNPQGVLSMVPEYPPGASMLHGHMRPEGARRPTEDTMETSPSVAGTAGGELMGSQGPSDARVSWGSWGLSYSEELSGEPQALRTSSYTLLDTSRVYDSGPLYGEGGQRGPLAGTMLSGLPSTPKARAGIYSPPHLGAPAELGGAQRPPPLSRIRITPASRSLSSGGAAEYPLPTSPVGVISSPSVRTLEWPASMQRRISHQGPEASLVHMAQPGGGDLASAQPHHSVVIRHEAVHEAVQQGSSIAGVPQEYLPPLRHSSTDPSLRPPPPPDTMGLAPSYRSPHPSLQGPRLLRSYSDPGRPGPPPGVQHGTLVGAPHQRTESHLYGTSLETLSGEGSIPAQGASRSFTSQGYGGPRSQAAGGYYGTRYGALEGYYQGVSGDLGASATLPPAHPGARMPTTSPSGWGSAAGETSYWPAHGEASSQWGATQYGAGGSMMHYGGPGYPLPGPPAPPGAAPAVPRQRRESLPKSAVILMKLWLLQHITHPYPTEQEKAELASSTGLAGNQINNWFINARVRMWKPLIAKVFEKHADRIEEEAKAGDDGELLQKVQDARRSCSSQLAVILMDQVATDDFVAQAQQQAQQVAEEEREMQAFLGGLPGGAGSSGALEQRDENVSVGGEATEGEPGSEGVREQQEVADAVGKLEMKKE